MMTLTQTRTDYAAARRAMIDSQLRTSGINEDIVLARMNAVAREDFVPDAARGTAYVDRAVPLGEGRFLAAPVFHGAMLAEARPVPADRALIVDGGSGYLPALVEPMVGEMSVVTPEAAVALKKRGRFTLILVDGAIEHVPAGLAKSLAEGGRIVTGLAERGLTRLATGRKAGGGVALLPLEEMGIPLLPAFAKSRGWSF